MTTSQLTLDERKALLRRLEIAYYSGAREIDSDGERIAYTSRDEMRAAMNDLAKSIAADEGSSSTGNGQTLRIFTTKGL